MKSFLIILLLELVLIINGQNNKSCKNVVECYAEAFQTIQLDREFLRQKVEDSAPNTKRITEEVRKDLLSGSLSEKDRKIDELQKQLKEQQETITELHKQVDSLQNYLKKIESENSGETQTIKNMMKNYRESSDKQTLDIQNTIKEIIKAQEEQQIHTKSIEDKHDNSDRKMDSKIKENQDQQLERIKRAEETIKNELGETKQIKEIKAAIKDSMAKLTQIQFNNNENINSQKDLTQKQEQYSHRLNKLEQESGSKDYVDKKVQQIKNELVVLQQHYSENKKSVEGSQKSLNSIYNEQTLLMGEAKVNIEKHSKLLKDAVYKDDVQAELQKLNHLLNSILKSQESLKQNMTYVQTKNSELEQNQLKQHSRLSDIFNNNTERGNIIKGEIQNELNLVRDKLYELNKQYELNKKKQEEVEQKSEEIDRKATFNVKKLELFQNETRQFQNEVLNKAELQKTFNQIQEKLNGLGKQMEQLKSTQLLLEQKQDDVGLSNQKNFKKLQDIQHENVKMENGLKTEINNGIDNLQLLIKSFQQNVQKLKADNEIFNERYQSAEDGILQLRSHVINMMSNAPDQNSKTFEQLQRKEINQQVKMVMNQINEIKSKQQEMQNKHQEMMRQYDIQQKLIQQQNTDIQQIQDLQKQGRKSIQQQFTDEELSLEKQYNKSRRLKGKPKKRKLASVDDLQKHSEKEKLNEYMAKNIEESVEAERNARLEKHRERNNERMKLDPILNSSNDLNSMQYKMKEYSSKKGRMGGCKHKIRSD